MWLKVGIILVIFLFRALIEGSSCWYSGERALALLQPTCMRLLIQL